MSEERLLILDIFKYFNTEKKIVIAGLGLQELLNPPQSFLEL